MNKLEKVENKISKIVTASTDIIPEKVSSEILDWVAENVVYFIDNKNRMFKLDLIIDDSKADMFPETKKLQDLYHSIPDNEIAGVNESKLKTKKDWTKQFSPSELSILEACGECRNQLDKITEKVHAVMRKDEERLAKIYEKMSYFYELKGINKGEFLIQELNGAVDIMRFDYEAYSVPVKVMKKEYVQREDGTLTETDKETVSEYTIPEGFSVWLEISFRAQANSLF